ncbi:MAG: DNA-directed RNA polymerase subunit alpha [Candidatus Moranbacteria bacterium]|nr:DNA-directed RNA polymerase subunit alpha [Candidatus Moranbacteria bacterium]
MLSVTLPESPKFEKIDNNKSKFIVESCYPGYGITLGNALRRVLLSSLGGSAVTEVKIKGVTHEFTTLKNVKEDVVQIVLNLKDIRFKLHDSDNAEVKLKAKGQKEVTAKDIKLPAGIEIANPEQHIATLTSKTADLEIDIKVEKGVGYVAVEQQEKEEKELGAIALDAAFSPIKRVNFSVDNMRVGKRTDYDKITLEVETDGTITPEEAYGEAVEALMSQFNALIDFKETSAVEEEDEAEEEKEVKQNKTEISALELSTRIHNVLESNGIRTVEDISSMAEKELKDLSGMGAKGVEEIKSAMKRLGYNLEA